MTPIVSKTWRFDAAQTDLAIVSFDSTHRGRIHGGSVTCAASNTADVSVRVGFGTATLPTITTNSATGGAGVPISHPGVSRGGGMVWAVSKEPMAIGAADEDIRLTCSAPTSGFVDVTVMYVIDDQ